MLSLGDQSASLLAAINEYEASKRKIIEHKVGKPVTVRQLSHSALPFSYTNDFRHVSPMDNVSTSTKF